MTRARTLALCGAASILVISALLVTLASSCASVTKPIAPPSPEPPPVTFAQQSYPLYGDATNERAAVAKGLAAGTIVVREGARGVIKLTPKARIDPSKLLAIIQDNPNVKFTPNGVLSFPMKAVGTEVIDVIEGLRHESAA